ncbi:hypothetical protein M011DRAFT_489911 [Sporormia fimetaria CBS 119925]|uniref:Uncharacterized protein n=1 Tax=Sporormia fimetaria CBS 119925 TaxID=1340428 RepID=A0A6A6V045_9PLEO|nr:hypothetical protein M011DRAFT_489911 [Sporormia fimetaria CBS 119925]
MARFRLMSFLEWKSKKQDLYQGSEKDLLRGDTDSEYDLPIPSYSEKESQIQHKEIPVQSDPIYVGGIYTVTDPKTGYFLCYNDGLLLMTPESVYSWTTTTFWKAVKLLSKAESEEKDREEARARKMKGYKKLSEQRLPTSPRVDWPKLSIKAATCCQQRSDHDSPRRERTRIKLEPNTPVLTLGDLFGRDLAQQLAGNVRAIDAAVEVTENIRTITVNKFEVDSDVPWPGSVYVISPVCSNTRLTLRKGELILEATGSYPHLSVHWELIYDNGNYSLRNVVSGNFIGRSIFAGLFSPLICHSPTLTGYDRVEIRHHPSGGYKPMSCCGSGKQPVVLSQVQGVTRLKPEFVTSTSNGAVLPKGGDFRFVKFNG